MAAVTVAGFAAYEASHRATPPSTTQADIPDVLSIVGGVGRATATLPTVAATPVSSAMGFPPAVEAWRTLVTEFFPADVVDQALEVMWCESRGDPGAVHAESGASGLFQHLPEFWAERSLGAGLEGSDIADPEANIAVAGWLFGHGGWSHWVASEACWGD